MICLLVYQTIRSMPERRNSVGKPGRIELGITMCILIARIIKYKQIRGGWAHGMRPERSSMQEEGHGHLT
jgi:hypothetical protein